MSEPSEMHSGSSSQALTKREDIRNIALVAHVDHGKTSLVDAILRQTRAHSKISQMGERILDSMDQERERGITIRAKNASVIYRGVKINLIDTPGHADFGGEVERVLRMVDGVLLLVDAKEGPMPQTTFVLRKALALGHPAIVVINKIDRPDAMPDDVLNRTFDLFAGLGATDAQLDFSTVYTSAILGTATLDLKNPGTDLHPLLDTVLERIPAPTIQSMTAPFQMLVLSLVSDPYKGKLGIGKIQAGSLGKRQSVVQMTRDGQSILGKVTELSVFAGLGRQDVEVAHAGEIVAVGGFPSITIGETLADGEHPFALPPVTIDPPTVQMTFGVNTSPFAGQEGKYLTSRHLRERLDKELETNVALRVQETEHADQFLVAGRGELHLAVLIEQMRREGYELQVSQPEVVLRREQETVWEPYEELTVHVPLEYQGTVIEEVSRRGGVLCHVNVVHADETTGEAHMDFHIPTRGVIGLKRMLQQKTRGTALTHHVFHGYEPADERDLMGAPHGSLVAWEAGVSNAYALHMIEERGDLFIGPGVEVYQGMVVGENARNEDLDVNVCKAKHLTNMRASGADEALTLTPPHLLSLEGALEYIGPDELVEVTPGNLRIRKRMLNPDQRRKSRKDRRA